MINCVNSQLISFSLLVDILHVIKYSLLYRIVKFITVLSRSQYISSLIYNYHCLLGYKLYYWKYSFNKRQLVYFSFDFSSLSFGCSVMVDVHYLCGSILSMVLVVQMISSHCWLWRTPMTQLRSSMQLINAQSL